MYRNYNLVLKKSCPKRRGNYSDSVVTLNLNINYPSSSTDVITACDFYTWLNGVTYTGNNNTATHILTNSVGCDSLVTLNLIINSVSDISTATSGLTITANNTSATYQWLDCNNSNIPISGESSQNFSATFNGSYAVELSENGCVDTSDCVVINDVGLEPNSESVISVFPNPGNGKVTVVLSSDYKENTTFQLTNSLGQLVYSGVFAAIENQLELNQAEGVYFLKVTSGTVSQTIELIIQP